MSISERLRKRLRVDRPMTTISIRMPEDVIDDLKMVAPELGFSGYQPLIRAYIGQGLRRDLAMLTRELPSVEEIGAEDISPLGQSEVIAVDVYDQTHMYTEQEADQPMNLGARRQRRRADRERRSLEAQEVSP